MALDLETSLVAICSAGDLDRLKALLPSGCETPSEEIIQDLLNAAARNSKLDVVNFLLEQYPTVRLNEEIVRGSIYTRSIAIFNALLARDPAIINMRFDMRGTPLIVACQSQQDVDYLRTLLEAGADPNIDPDTSIYPIALVASLGGYTDAAAIDLLLRHGARPEGTGALAYAAMNGKDAVVLSLLKAGACPQAEANAAPGGYYATPSPLHAAVIHGHESVVGLLLEYGADPNAVDNKGLTATDHAMQMSRDGKNVSSIIDILENQG